MANPCRTIGQHHNARSRVIKFKHDPRRAPTSRLKPTSSAVPTASAKQENNNNNEEQRLNIHDVHSFSAMAALACPQYLSSTSYGRRRRTKKEVGEFRNNNMSATLLTRNVSNTPAAPKSDESNLLLLNPMMGVEVVRHQTRIKSIAFARHGSDD
jgi:hypothetical protein